MRAAARELVILYEAVAVQVATVTIRGLALR
jgi:hypothetical protein